MKRTSRQRKCQGHCNKLSLALIVRGPHALSAHCCARWRPSTAASLLSSRSFRSAALFALQLLACRSEFVTVETARRIGGFQQMGFRSPKLDPGFMIGAAHVRWAGQRPGSQKRSPTGTRYTFTPDRVGFPPGIVAAAGSTRRPASAPRFGPWPTSSWLSRNGLLTLRRKIIWSTCG